ncbi:MAG: galactokinase [Clostridia bacterium]|nr:galactokinase [Clostridia bacterium]
MASKERILLLAEDTKFQLTARVLYGNCDFYKMAERYVTLSELHVKSFGVNNFEFYSSPGRIEVCGNHTDHNNGKVLCASITVDTLGAVTALDDNSIKIASQGYPVIDVNLDNLDKVAREEGTSTALVKGVVRYLKERGYAIGGFVATTTSSVFKGAGVSSSASFELFVAEILSSIYNGGKIDAVTKAKAAQWAESYYFNKPCGLMDQSAIALGGISYIDFASSENPLIEHIDWIFNDLDIILINTGGDHSALTSHYSAIRAEMEAISSYFGKKVLREVERDVFYGSLSKLKELYSGRAILRAIHYYEENARVELCAQAVRDGDSDAFVNIINQSGDSSYKLLQNCYAPEDTTQCIPLAIELARRICGVKGVRVHGGGFAGTVIVFASSDNTEDICSKLIELYGDNNVYTVRVRNSGATGTGLKFIKE